MPGPDLSLFGRRRLGLALAALLLFACSPGVWAHEVRPAYLQITEHEPGTFEVVWKQPILGDRRLPLDPVLPEACAEVGQTAFENTGSALLQRWTVRCDMRAGEVRISGLSRTLTDVMLEISYQDGDSVRQLLRPSQPSLDLSDPAPPVATYLLFGVEHLLFGIDHILFVVGLVLFIGNPWMLLKTITSFTVAHSVTLALSVLGLVRLPQAPVEAVIALSILFLARELMVEKEQQSRIMQIRPWVIAFAFGLLHGFGFAGALADIGLPRAQLATSLFLFNVGIELGQLLIIGLVLATLWLAARLWQERAHLLTRAFAGGVGCLAAFWTIDRVLLIG
ncbi:MAG: HupE/UreJ family protein [Pseudomonadales bacterium]